MKELEILPEGWVDPIRFGGVSYCGKADPGISIAVKMRSARGWYGFAGGALTIKQAQSIIDHLTITIQQAKTAPKFRDIPSLMEYPKPS